MGSLMQIRDAWANKQRDLNSVKNEGQKGRKSDLVIASPSEEELKRLNEEGFQDALTSGFKAASIACVAFTTVTLVAVRTNRWAKENINHTGQALIICSGTIATFVFNADKTGEEIKQRNRQRLYEKSKSN